MSSTETVTCATCELHAEAVFRVEGMDCNEEVVILERRLKPLTGLEAVSADLIGQRLHVKYDAAKLTTAAIVDAVGQTGMRMWLEHEEPSRRRHPSCRGAGGSWWRARSRWRRRSRCRLTGRATAAAVVLTAAAVAGGVFPARRAVAAIRSRTLDINALMVVAVVGALVLGEWLEAATVVFLFAVAQWLEVRTHGARPPGDSRADRSVAARGDRQARRRGRACAGGGRRASATRSSCGRATRCRSTASLSPATATSTRHR